MSEVPALECRALKKSYADGRVVLSGLDFTLNAGEYIAIMGESGVGKSTLLNMIAGLDTPDSGSVLIDGAIMSQLTDDEATRLRRQKLGFIFQAFHVLPHLSLMQNISLPLLLNGESPARATQMLKAVGLDGRGSDFPRQLSGGELQRVAIARALVHRPTLVMADEPTGNLDPATAQGILKLLRDEIKANGASAIMVTHSMAAASTADRILILTSDGLHPLAPRTEHIAASLHAE
ncbi:ABC transporter ATP-binding protein [Undibacterium sp. RTI2.1]|uniref:ABC transporter ATP-binding protein n=1 Tax=unclassified Undibacterium TaxID=2630295 RepID=UPI002AB51CAA|nr:MULTISPECIES: ABC transporter ATP-binding protein [unclassified Undibacterium]MDY7537259.1 ABC transporter ATP-binding protein [Undibacterium sp. 5I1]MEB0031848.1 ABC transporter ATP-binding protein [Undibacterium sp. RTI2.1]MEB0117558.1 ABC transporter ATP-binding protein [Undibacterium sp. RTI2.2]MEB0230328.1 ABC transporter ATP-binding protein [Undibacterium sp. 10I3]MEB0258162.1 ABC transporter ATP-binding protein [Undibacterium sp. 5I1]